MTTRIYPTAHHSQHELALELLNALDAMVSYWDRDECCLFANSAFRVWFDRDGKELIGVGLRDFLGPLYASTLPYIKRVYAGEKQVFPRAIQGPNGVVRNCLVTYIPRIIDAEVDGFFVHVADVGPMKLRMEVLRAAKKAAERTAAHDYLTGLPNRLQLSVKLASTLSHATKQHVGFALITIDLDKFKQINDTFGHAEGDAFLVEMTKRIIGSMRESDTLLRTGGDEFLLIAKEINTVEHATVFAERVVASVRQMYRIGENLVRPSLSAGVAIFPDDAGTVAELLKVSDEALYFAKNAGRDCFSFGDRGRAQMLRA